MIIVEKDGKRYEVTDEGLAKTIELAIDCPEMTFPVDKPEGVSDIDWVAVKEGKVKLNDVLKVNETMQEQTDEPIVANMVAIIESDTFETSEPLGAISGWTQQEFDEALERKLEKVRRDNPGCSVHATEA